MNTHTKTILVVVGVGMGIVIGEKSVYGSEVAVASLLLFIFQLGVYMWSKKKVGDRGDVGGEGSVIVLVSLLLFISISVGIVRMQFVTEAKRFVCESSCTFDARVVSAPEIQDAYQVIDVKPRVDDVGETENVRIRVPLYPSYKVGETLTLKGRVTIPKAIPPHDGKKPFDYERYLLLKGVGSEMFFPSVIGVTETELSFSERLMTFKSSLVAIVDTYVSQPSASLAAGMLLGDTQMGKELLQTFRVAGLSHIIVLSGFNIAILITALLLLLKFLPLVLRVFIASAVVIVFVIMVGAEASVVRATLMAFIALLALLVGRGYVAPQALLLSFLAIILYTPEALLSDVSLHLSFLATAGIVYMSEGIKSLVEKVIERFSLLSSLSTYGYQEIIATTLAAYFATLPYVMYTFGTVSVYGLIANFLVLPLVPIIMLMTFVTILLSSLSTLLASVLGYLVTLLCAAIIWVARSVESIPYSSFPITINFISMTMMYLAVTFLYMFLVTRKKNETHHTNDDEIISDIILY